MTAPIVSTSAFVFIFSRWQPLKSHGAFEPAMKWLACGMVVVQRNQLFHAWFVLTFETNPVAFDFVIRQSHSCLFLSTIRSVGGTYTRFHRLSLIATRTAHTSASLLLCRHRYDDLFETQVETIVLSIPVASFA